jgi:hypothetical protein
MTHAVEYLLHRPVLFIALVLVWFAVCRVWVGEPL